MGRINWIFVERYEYRDEAQRVLDKVKENRATRKYKIVRVNAYTWVEIPEGREYKERTKLSKRVLPTSGVDKSIAWIDMSDDYSFSYFK